MEWRITFIIKDRFIRQRAMQAVKEAQDGTEVIIKPPSRSLDQNALLWPLLTELSNQVEWYGNKLTPEEWKDLMTAGLKKQKAVPGIDGGFVVIGAHTSKMSKTEFRDLIELVYSFGSERGVTWERVDI
jgi:hypothetical protein